MKRLCTFVLILFSFVPAQTLNRESIKNSGAYYWGESSSPNVREAEDRALSNLTQTIAVNVSSQFNSRVIETSKDMNTVVENIIKTYSTATLKNVKTDRVNNNSEINVFRYIEKAEVEKIFSARKDLVRNIYANAENFKNIGNFGYALKLYYFALVLINSLPDQLIEHKLQNLVTIIPQQINGIIAALKFEFISDKLQGDERIIEFAINGFGIPASYLEFSFWDGNDQVDVRAMDGRGVLQLFGSGGNLKKLDVQVKYSFYEAKDEIKEVGELWDLVVKPPFQNSRQVILERTEPAGPVVKDTVEIFTPAPSDIKTKNRFASLEKNSFTMELTNNSNCPVVEKIANETLPLLELMKQKDIPGINKYLEGDSFLRKKVTDMMKYNAIVFTDNAVNGGVMKTANGWELRKVEILANYATLKKQSREYLVFDFDSLGILYDVNFGISETAYRSFLEQNPNLQDWDKKQVMIKFVEKYRTAYLDRDISTLDSLFSDDAVVIVGRILETRKIKPNEMYKYIPTELQPNFQQIKYTKDQYLKSQAKLFASRKDIFLGLSTVGISKKNRETDVYGLSMRQNFNSTGYSDEGYLFLLVDFKKELPQIYVRSWQPQEYNEETLIQLSNFKVNK